MSTLIQLQDVTKAYGPVPLLDAVNAVFAKGDKIGVIGRNGAGKSTLCKIILGDEEADGGRVRKSPDLVLGYLEQRDPFDPGERVLEFLMRYTGEEDWQCGKIAGRFQLKNEVLEAEIGSLPGGFQTRVKLAAMMLRRPNFLILDEPTNYLDLKTLILLEHFLRDFAGGFLIVSHDREFLRKTCEITLDVERGELVRYTGGIDEYLEFKSEQRELSERQNRNIEAKRRDLEKFIAKNRVRASTASRAQSKMKALEKLETVEVEGDLATAHIRLPELPVKKGVALRCEGLSIGYPDHVVADGIHFEIERGQHVAVLGDNGQGKTTFLRTITEDLAPLDGSYQWGHALGRAYYAQHVYQAIDAKLDVYTHLERAAASETTRQEILRMAGSFLFRGDDVEKKVGVLSGGERARLSLAGLLLSKEPVLLLDEPTNHLDFETVEALGAALRDYRGTIFFISHDRTFVDLVATNIVEVDDGRVTLYPGDYASYVYRTEQEVEADEDVVRTPKPAAKRGGDKRPRGRAQGAEKVNDKARRKELRARSRQLSKDIEKIEKRIASYEEEREQINQYYLENPNEFSKEKQARMEELRTLIEGAESRWAKLSEELEPLEEEIAKL